MKKIVATDQAPAAVGPYSQAVWAGPLLFISGQIPIKGGNLLQGSIEEQTEVVLSNLKGILSSQGLNLESVIKTTVFLKNINDFSKMNDIYARYFSSLPPARSTVEVSALPKGVAVEIDAVAYKGGA